MYAADVVDRLIEAAEDARAKAEALRGQRDEDRAAIEYHVAIALHTVAHVFAAVHDDGGDET